MRGEAIESAIRKAGYRLADRYSWARDRGSSSKCDCDVVRVEFNRTWQIKPACTNDSHHDRQVNQDHVAEKQRQKAIAEKLGHLTEVVGILIADLPIELVRLMAVNRRNELLELWTASDEGEIRKRAATSVAQLADTTYAWPAEDRPKHDANLDEVLAALEKLAAA